MPHFRLAERVLLRKFDGYYAYNARSDELYELDEEAFNFLLNCDGNVDVEDDFLTYLLDEGLVVEGERKEEVEIDFASAREPSLRYLLLNITWDCNLKCRHCYVEKRDEYMRPDTFKAAVKEFASMGGLKLMISGGEPLVHKQIWEMLEYARKYPQRVVLLTNGYLVGRNVKRLAELVDEVQISLDGLEGHKKLRNADYRPLLDVIEKLSGVVDVSVSTMVTKYSVEDIPKLSEILSRLDVKRWMLDVPTTSPDILPPLNVAAEILSNFGFGELSHESSGDYACGANLAAVTPSGDVTKCGFFTESAGKIEERLEVCWERLKERYMWKLSELKCSCEHIEVCRGGCRYRAMKFTGDIMGCDPVMCLLYSQSPCGTHQRS